MTNDPNSEETREIEKYIYGFAKEKGRCGEPGDNDHGNVDAKSKSVD